MYNIIWHRYLPIIFVYAVGTITLSTYNITHYITPENTNTFVLYII